MVRGADFDFGLWDGSRKPDYNPVFAERTRRLAWLRALEIADEGERAHQSAARFAQIRAYYATAPEGIADFIEDWGMTFDPTVKFMGLPTKLPFLLFPKQREFVNEIVACWRAGEDLLADKTRQMGFSWLAVAVGVSLCVLMDGMVVGYGSRKEEYVDKIGSPKALFPKARQFAASLPAEFRGGFVPGKTDAFMSLKFPGTGSIIMGEAGANIGRGATTDLYIVDESAFLEHPELVDASLGQGHRCRLDISTPNGLGNAFAQRRFGGVVKVFTMHWRDDPRKNDAWYAKMKDKLSAVVLAQEVDIDYSASVAGVVIPGAWLRACVDSHLKLGIEPTGRRSAAFDVADEGNDPCAVAISHGILVEDAIEWPGLGADIHKSTLTAFGYCDANDIEELTYDADGLGAGVRGAGRVINETRVKNHRLPIRLRAFRGSAAVVFPKREQEKGRKNEDYFYNCKAQSWHWLKHLVYCTYRAVTEEAKFDPDEIISFNGKMKNLQKLLAELSQPTWEENTTGKMIVNKTPEGTKSPNLADSVMMLYSPARRMPIKISQGALDAA